MSRQDRTTTERHAKILRELVKQPDNKICADCKKNGICKMGFVEHVFIGLWELTSVEHVRKWGNRRANIYWEAHLKAGHIPPDHKIESFIRSKYESRRWAMRSPLPEDPSVLENHTQAVPGNRPAAAAPTSASTQLPSLAPVVETSATSKPAPSAVGSGAGLFALDFKAPTPTSASQRPKSSTNDILSLFSASSGPPAYSQTAIPQQQRQQQQSYHQQSQSRPQQQQPAVFGQLGSYNAPPTLAPQGQTAYATWTGASGVTAPSVASPANTGLASGMAGLSMGGADVWGAAAPVSQPRAPSVASPYNAQPPAPSAAPYAPAASNHYFSSQDVSGTGVATTANSNGSAAGGMSSPEGFGAFDGAPSSGGASQVKDPFANIWN
ncbi:hypothetical protein QFC20_002426 [Naganishia adeliensis]|uniref:Uncharacterized protein n=1 Tax=Naganishia adeliensis TaxID=92952 RepID=A0ACC2WL01_9TREE|nr:hypothetical protein QFC20_002426 [Naganishia adeliensis]